MYEDSKYKEYLEIIKTSKGIRCFLRKEMCNAYLKLLKGDECKYIIIINRIIFYKWSVSLERYIIVTISALNGKGIEKYI